MLDYRRDRVDYGEMLIPPQGYRLERAVAATYSVDLNTLLSVPVALIYAQTMEGKLDGDRFQILEAIQQIAKLVTVYHQKGQLHVPSKYNRLYAFLEDMLVPVYPATAFTSLHPKLWVLRYGHEAADQPAVYRVLVLSRNLTYDRSWDVAVCLEGVEGSDVEDRSRPLADFLRHLDGEAPFENAAAFVRGVSRTKFIAPDGFRRPTFHPIGIPRYYTNPIQTARGDRAVVMSPFIDAGAIQDVTSNIRKEVHLFSRRSELAKEAPSTLEGLTACYAISDWIVDGERQIEADSIAGAEIQEQDLHAKVYVLEDAGRSTWFLGSGNLTRAAFTRNTEFFVELIGKGNGSGVNGLLKELLGEDGALGVFSLFDATLGTNDDPASESRNAMRRIEYALLDAPVEAELVRSPNQTNFDMAVRLDLQAVPTVDGMVISVRPLNVVSDPRKLRPDSKNEIVFPNIQETELSRFLVYHLDLGDEAHRKFLVKINVIGMPRSRHDSIFKSIVSNQEKFFEYLSFLLSDERSKEDLLGNDDDSARHGHGDGEQQWHFDAPVFEQLLVAASRSPRKLQQVDALIDRLRKGEEDGDVIVPQEFIDFWDMFKPLIPANVRGK